MKYVFVDESWKIIYIKIDKKKVKKINELLKDISSHEE
jgi:toxin YoeB